MDQKSSQTLHEALRRASIFLEKNQMDPELAKTYWLMAFDWNLTQLVQALHQPVPPADIQYFESILKRLANAEPIQYILGYADFMGERFKVTPDTLIPREETAGIIELVRAFLEEKPTAQVLDIGTGTGILAIMLKKLFPRTQLTAVDISQTALAIAKENAQQIDVEVNFIQSDLLKAIDLEQKFDLVVSNPPYISVHESDLMDESVKKFEPPLALFAENNGLAIYQQLAQTLPAFMNQQGRIIFEIGYRQGNLVKKLFEAAFPQARVDVFQDYNQLERYVVIQLD
ncbi:peptide chain release factor N(5)-glutamine methyltransferase [Fundicoccus culcitae]|uniref:Release factor glutamine methyltransferase n=1 Tax=Fundicoccus culcitae TaxID=2969821 RepID=A0ABY5P5L9_9LACT|nr:peptide chain release factor N(5)-glutamine methyltransferase [Fundicoccus culcitae]UUX33979.1 peptide chain release factor N(5)-glutamine methyltransferase [Fundicoccus culcitae]